MCEHFKTYFWLAKTPVPNSVEVAGNLQCMVSLSVLEGIELRSVSDGKETSC